jgi:hypothetical protein
MDECECCGCHECEEVEESEKESEDDSGEEEREIDVMEFTLDEDEIDELIAKLIELKETKIPCVFEIDEDNEIVINYGEDSEEDEE